MINAIIVDDCSQAIDMLKKNIARYCPEVNLIGQALNFDNGKALINLTNADILFLDIELGDKNGFDLLSEVEIGKTNVIFTTAHAEYSLKAFKFNAVHYLVKPIIIEELKDAVLRVSNLLRERNFDNSELINEIKQYKDSQKKILQISSERETLFIDVNDIEFLKADGNYTKIFLIDGESVIASKLLKDFEKSLPEPAFYRISRVHLINLSQVRSMTKKGGGSIEMINGSTIQIPRRKTKDFLIKMAEYGGE